MHLVKTSHLAGPQTHPHARRAVRRVGPFILPYEGMYRARAALGHKEGDHALPAPGGDDRLIRPYGAVIGGVLVGKRGVTVAMKSAAQPIEVERSSWTIELVSFQFRPIRVESACCNAQSHTASQ